MQPMEASGDNGSLSALKAAEDQRLQDIFFAEPTKAIACVRIFDHDPRHAMIITLSEPGDAIMDYGDFEDDSQPITFWDAIRPKDHQLVVRMFEKILHKGKPASADVHWTTYPGRHKLVQFKAKPFPSPYYPDLVEMEIRDITKREVTPEIERIIVKRKKLRPFFKDIAAIIDYTISPVSTTILVLDSDDQGFIVENVIETKYGDYLWPSIMKKGETNISDFPTLQYLSEKRKPMIWDDVNEAAYHGAIPVWKPHSQERPYSNFFSVLGFPIINQDGQLRGFFFLSHMLKEYFQDRDVKILQYLAPAMAEAIDTLPG